LFVVCVRLLCERIMSKQMREWWWCDIQERMETIELVPGVVFERLSQVGSPASSVLSVRIFYYISQSQVYIFTLLLLHDKICARYTRNTSGLCFSLPITSIKKRWNLILNMYILFYIWVFARSYVSCKPTYYAGYLHKMYE
jgi:hypothetical protein